MTKEWTFNQCQYDPAGAAAEIERLQRREREARAILEPLAEYDPAVRAWLKEEA